MPIDSFLHEGLHFQFQFYWREDKNSPVSELNDDEFDYLKEALTVVLDEELAPVITVPNMGYPNQTEFRKLLHREWKKHHNFHGLVEYGLMLLPRFFSQ